MYAELEIRKGRPVYSKSIRELDGVAEVNEEFNLIVSSTSAYLSVFSFSFSF